MIRRKRSQKLWTPTVAATGWSESTFAEQAWDQSRGAGQRWAIGGLVVGLLVALIVFAPAAWLADSVARATQGRLLLADARGSVWSGSAVVVLTGGADSRDASALPGRIEWHIAPRFYGVEVLASQACCLNGNVKIQLRPGLGRMTATLVPTPDWVGQWPSAWLGGLGTPWNTLQLGGTVRLASPGLTLESVQGRWRVDGKADVELLNASSRLTTLETLGSYRLTIAGDAADKVGGTRLSLSTQDGTLLLLGSGLWSPTGVYFRGEARAAPSEESALSNLLNIIGRRDGARSVISIG